MNPSLSPLMIADSAPLAAVAASLIRLRQKQTLTNLIVTSCNAGEGKTTVALQIARAAVLESELRVLLIDGNPANPRLADLLSCDPVPGFADFLDGRVAEDVIIRATTVKGLDLMPFGSPGPGRASRYDPGRLRSKLPWLSGTESAGYDLIVLDGPSSFGEFDLTASASLFDGVVLVIECERTRWEVVRNYQDRLRDGNANLLGAVMNKRRYYIPKGLYV